MLANFKIRKIFENWIKNKQKLLINIKKEICKKKLFIILKPDFKLIILSLYLLSINNYNEVINFLLSIIIFIYFCTNRISN